MFKLVQLPRRRLERGVYKYSDEWDPGHEFPQQTQPLRLHLIGPKGKTRDVTVGSIEACDKTGLNGVASHPKDDRDRRGRSLGG
jgi:hypothetical protein